MRPKGGKMPQVDGIKNDLEVIKKVILEKVPTEQIWLFGSFAYGTPNKDSDIDIYIVMKDDTNMRTGEAIDEVSYALFFSIPDKAFDILAMKRSRFLAKGALATMERMIMREGVKIYG
jgi:predicted nucleotidyltransferase